ncbi:MAG TPA: bacteriohemerythrin [Azospirillaceae bacterium]|nr:bacteriohemerythrin [Azospirillaceae bacterium]
MLKNVGIKYKVLMIMLLNIIGLLVILGLSIADLRSEMLADRQAKTRNLVETAYGLLAHYESRVRSGAMTTEMAQDAALAVLRDLRYDREEYFWVNDLKPMMVMHPFKRELEGKDLSSFADPEGKRLFMEFVSTVKRQGEGFVDYHWPKPGHDTPVPKVSYVKGFEPWGWIVGSGIYVDDVQRAFFAAAFRLGGLCLLLTLIGGAIALVVSRSVIRPILELTGVMRRLADGDTDLEVPSTDHRDEMGLMARALEVFKGAQIELKDSWERQQMEHRVREQRTMALERLARRFDETVTNTVSHLADAARLLERTAGAMSSVASQTALQATTVAAASEQASANVQTVATAAEELSGSVSEINFQVTRSTEISADAVEASRQANQLVVGLTTTTQRIGEVVGLITQIAGQTNLLALNATIEAARAGEAGKGFAVVAGEVKNLASQTAQATDDITTQIQAVQSATTNAVDAIQGITGIIAQINEIGTAIAAAVQEQGAATGEIARSAHEAADGTMQVSHNIGGVTAGADDTGRAASEVLTAAKELTHDAENLREMVDTFLINVRAISSTNLADLYGTSESTRFMSWNDALSTSHEDIDNDHLILIGLVNNLHAALGSGRASGEVIGTALTQLLAYTGTHFHFEEGLMQEHGYPEFAQHKAQHEAFVKKALDLLKRYKAGEAGVGPELMALLKTWLVEHIQGTDKRLGTFLGQRNLSRFAA